MFNTNKRNPFSKEGAVNVAASGQHQNGATLKPKSILKPSQQQPSSTSTFGAPSKNPFASAPQTSGTTWINPRTGGKNPFAAAAATKNPFAPKPEEGGGGFSFKGAGSEARGRNPFVAKAPESKPDSTRDAPKGPRIERTGQGSNNRPQRRKSHDYYQEAPRGRDLSRPGRRRSSSWDESQNQDASKHRRASADRGRGDFRGARGPGRGRGDFSGRGGQGDASGYSLNRHVDLSPAQAPYGDSQPVVPANLGVPPTQSSDLLDRDFIFKWAKALATSQNFDISDSGFTEIVDALEDRFEQDGLAHVQIHTVFGDPDTSSSILKAATFAVLAANEGQPVTAYLSAHIDDQAEEIQYPGIIDQNWIHQWLKSLYEKRNQTETGLRLQELTGNVVNVIEDYGYLQRPLNEILNDRTAVEFICATFNDKLFGVTSSEFWSIVDLVTKSNSGGVDTEIIEAQQELSVGGKGKHRAEGVSGPPAGSLVMAPNSAATPYLGQFLNQINGFLKVQNEKGLEEYIALEPPFSSSYQSIIDEVREAYPRGSEDALEEKCSQALTVARDGIDGSANWTQFTKFMVQYLSYLRDVDADPSKYLETYELLYELQKRANSALIHPSLGGLMLPIVISCARLICRLAIGLDKQPELIAHVKSAASEEGPRQTLPERAAELLRGGLVTCLNDRFSGLDGFGKPEGKKRGIYKIANICLKIFFQCRKTRNAEMIFTNIGNLSPPLSAYPKRERVTYLYYLGRFWFQNSHFLRARLALEAAYDESPANMGCVRQRRHILIYLMASNIIMGRFPMPALFQRPEAQALYDRFMPLMQAIRSGNLAQFRQHLDLDSPHADWFLHFRILLQLKNRCEVLVWRSLVRKAYMLFGTPYTGEGATAPLIDLNGLTTLFQALERQSLKPAYVSYIDPDLDGASGEDEEEDRLLLPSTTSIESILSSLVEQGFLTGFISHAKLKFVIQGAKQAGGNVLAAGFPQPWAAIERRTNAEKASQVPGWKMGPARGLAAGALGGGMVVNLSGARPVGAA